MEAEDSAYTELSARRSKTLPFPKVVPLQYPFLGDKFYVRKCYLEYYDRVVGKFDNPRVRGVTVTGTPGIGKSVFMGYFFERYRQEHSETTFVLVSFNVDSVLKRAVEWNDGSASVTKASDLITVDFEHAADPDKLFLLDGPPNVTPEWHRYVVFTSPNESWERQTWKDPTHSRLVMPLWDQDELIDAADALQLHGRLDRIEVEDFPRLDNPRHNQEVLYRYDVFGGVARACLETDKDVVEQQLNDLETAAKTLDMETSMEMAGNKDVRAMCHRLYHCVPSESLMMWELKLASPYVKQMLTQRVEELTEDERSRLRRHIDRLPSLAMVFGVIHENDVHRQLENGCSLEARRLLPVAGLSGRQETRAPCDPLSVKIPPSSPVVLLENNFKKNDIVGGPYFIPKAKTFEAIDGFCLVDADNHDNSADAPWRDMSVLLFQMTVSYRHPVKGRGLNAVLTALGIEQEDFARKVALVFVVPAYKADKFTWQYIEASSPLDDNSPITAVNGIANKIPNALEGTHISTVGHLRTLPANADLATAGQREAYAEAQRRLESHESRAVVSNGSVHVALKGIPQFVWGV